jgi:hypothetical protein
VLKRVLRLALGAAMLAGCGSRTDFHCNDLVAPEQATFTQVKALVVDQRAATSCSNCHYSDFPVKGLDFLDPGNAYDGLTRRRNVVYEQVASGEMPKDGPPWEADELQILRSWYCYGAPYAP